jgi:uncharacterized protein DUF397
MVAMVDLSAATWRKSTRSGGNGGACVEVSTNLPVVAVRDSKNPTGPALLVHPQAFAAFTATVKAARLGGRDA